MHLRTPPVFFRRGIGGRGSNMRKRLGRGVLAIALIAATALTAPSSALARHGHSNGAGIALGIIGGIVAGAAIASAATPGYYYAPPAYYYPYAPQAYSAAPGYYYSQPQPYYGSYPYYYGN
jgi:hypothetical protein